MIDLDNIECLEPEFEVLYFISWMSYNVLHVRGKSKFILPRIFKTEYARHETYGLIWENKKANKKMVIIFSGGGPGLLVKNNRDESEVYCYKPIELADKLIEFTEGDDPMDYYWWQEKGAIELECDKICPEIAAEHEEQRRLAPI